MDTSHPRWRINYYSKSQASSSRYGRNNRSASGIERVYPQLEDSFWNIEFEKLSFFENFSLILFCFTAEQRRAEKTRLYTLVCENYIASTYTLRNDLSSFLFLIPEVSLSWGKKNPGVIKCVSKPLFFPPLFSQLQLLGCAVLWQPLRLARALVPHTRL